MILRYLLVLCDLILYYLNIENLINGCIFITVKGALFHAPGFYIAVGGGGGQWRGLNSHFST